MRTLSNPSNVSVGGGQIAPLATRLLAALIDFGAFILVMFTVGILGVLIASASENAAVAVWPVELVILIGFAIWNLGIRQGGPREASLGKSAMKLRLVDAYTDDAVGKTRGVLRLCLRFVDFFFAIGLIHAIIDVENQTVVDRIMHTLVVAE